MPKLYCVERKSVVCKNGHAPGTFTSFFKGGGYQVVALVGDREAGNIHAHGGHGRKRRRRSNFPTDKEASRLTRPLGPVCSPQQEHGNEQVLRVGAHVQGQGHKHRRRPRKRQFELRRVGQVLVAGGRAVGTGPRSSDRLGVPRPRRLVARAAEQPAHVQRFEVPQEIGQVHPVRAAHVLQRFEIRLLLQAFGPRIFGIVRETAVPRRFAPWVAKLQQLLRVDFHHLKHRVSMAHDDPFGREVRVAALGTASANQIA